MPANARSGSVPSRPTAANCAICIRIVQVFNRLYAWRGSFAESQFPRQWGLAPAHFSAFISEGRNGTGRTAVGSRTATSSSSGAAGCAMRSRFWQGTGLSPTPGPRPVPFLGALLARVPGSEDEPEWRGQRGTCRVPPLKHPSLLESTRSLPLDAIAENDGRCSRTLSGPRPLGTR